MKKCILTFVSALLLASASPLCAENVGVPAECEDVMLQAFYWNSYTLTKYGRTLWRDLANESDAINANFDLVWLPPSAKSIGGVGYYHTQLSNQESAWGSKIKLNEIIGKFHDGNTKVIADIVINHRGSVDGWCNFAKDNFGTYGSYQLTNAHICSGDECFWSDESNCRNSSEHGAEDTGTNDPGARDLDHSSEFVQTWAKAYVQWMLNNMNYDGFRYDMTRGYHGRYLSMYNETAQPYFSVSEYWESIDNTVMHLQQANYNTMIFDFPLKWKIQNAFKIGQYAPLRNPGESLRGKGYGKYAVTFIDNHDTFERSDNQGGEFIKYNANLKDASVKNKILQANAYILMLPGVPCVFWPHWTSYREEINRLIAIRKQAGVHSESEIEEEVKNNVYEAKVKGHRGTVILRLGKNRSKEVPEGYELAMEDGDVSEFTIFIQKSGEGIETVDGERLTVKGEKFLRDGKLYIRVNDKVYNITGKQIQ